jgi:hypothetical protein
VRDRRTANLVFSLSFDSYQLKALSCA